MARNTTYATYGFSVVLVLGNLMVGCNDSRPSPAPTPVTRPAASTPEPTPPADTPTVTVSGTVYEHLVSDAHPLAQVRLSITTSTDPDPWGYGGPVFTSDASGHFEVSLDIGSLFIVDASYTGYYAPCPPHIGTVTKDTTVDIHLVPYSVLSSTGMPESLPTWYPKVSGKVFEGVYEGGQLTHESPVPGVEVSLSDVPDGAVRTVTVADARGRYVLCTPTVADVGQTAWLGTRRNGLLTHYQPLEITGNDTVSFDVGAAPGY